MKKISMLLAVVLTAIVMTGCHDEETDIRKFIVTFNSQGGSETPSQEVHAGNKAVKPADPTKDKSHFTGWYKEAACTSIWDFETETVSENTTLYAGWTSVTYTVTFESNGGSTIETQQVAEGAFATKPHPAPTKEGHLFEAWYTEQTLNNLFIFHTPIVKDITLYAGWQSVSSISHDDLVQLFNEAQNLINSVHIYTPESIGKLIEATEETRPVAENKQASTEETIKAYQTLNNAIQALSELPYHPTDYLEIYPVPNTDRSIPVYTDAGKTDFTLTVRGLDNNGQSSTRPDITFEFDDEEMEQWGNYTSGDNYINISLRPNLSATAELTIRIKCNDAPLLSTFVILKAIDKEGLKKQYINSINEIAGKEITFDNYETLKKEADKINYAYWNLPEDLKNDNEVQAALYKLNSLSFFSDFTRYTYQFKGSTCTIRKGENQVWEYQYTPNGPFPCGTYTGKWEWKTDYYYQMKMELIDNGTYRSYQRGSLDKEENSEWQEKNHGHYKITGNQAEGGILHLQISRNE